jgi:hypothetical protein
MPIDHTEKTICYPFNNVSNKAPVPYLFYQQLNQQLNSRHPHACFH